MDTGHLSTIKTRVYDPKYLARNEARVMNFRLKIGLLKGFMLSEILVFNLYIQPKSVPERALNERGGSSSSFDDRVYIHARIAYSISVVRSRCLPAY